MILESQLKKQQGTHRQVQGQGRQPKADGQGEDNGHEQERCQEVALQQTRHGQATPHPATHVTQPQRDWQLNHNSHDKEGRQEAALQQTRHGQATLYPAASPPMRSCTAWEASTHTTILAHAECTSMANCGLHSIYDHFVTHALVVSSDTALDQTSAETATGGEHNQ